MKILMINQSDIGGGAEKIALTLCEQLNKKQIICDLYVDVKKSNSPNVHSLNRSNLNKKLSKIINKGLNQQSKFCGNTKYLELKLKEYDLVHIHNLHGNYLNLDIVKKINDLNIPIVWTLHDIWPLTGRCCIEYDCDGFTRECGECKEKIWGYPKMFLDNSKMILKFKQRILKNSNITFISPSIFMSNLISVSYLKNNDVKVINNGIDIDIFKPNKKEELKKKYNLDVNKKYILIIAAKLNNKSKGTHIALEMIQGLKEKDKIGIITVGKGLNLNYISDMEIINFGYINNPQKLNEIYSMSDIFLNCTLADNFPTTNLEAMASGTPVFATNIGGNKEQINNEFGWLFDHKNIDEATRLLERVIKSTDELEYKSIRCRHISEQLYNIDTMLDKHINLYKTIISSKLDKGI